MDGSFFASQNGVWRIDVRYHNATGVSPEAGTVSYYLTVGPALTQTITFDPIPTHAFGDAPFALHATAASGLPVALSVVSGPATLSGDVITLTGNGAVTVRAAQAGGMVSGTFWNAAPPVDRTFSVIGIAQTISFAALPARTQADPPFALTATASSGLPVTFSVTAGPAIISGNVVSLTGAGTVVITAVQNGGGVFGSALTVSRSFTVSPVPPPEITSASAVEARVGTQFDYAFTFTQPVSAMIWDAGYLPAGLEWSGPLGGMYGRISGTPTVSGIFSLVFRPWGAVGVGPSFTLVIDVKTSSGLSVPTIITQPQNRIAAAGAYVFLNVHASSASSYLWYKDGAALTYQISPFMVVFAAGAVDVGTYAVVVRNSAGSVTSAPATLSVEGLPPPPPPVVGALPVIVTQPQDLTVPAGQAASYTVAAASATPLAYQWLRNGVLIAGATANSFSILQTSYASNGHFYSVVVSNSAGSVASEAAELLVTGPVLKVSQLRPNSFRLSWTSETSGGNDVSYRVVIPDRLVPLDVTPAVSPFDVDGLTPATPFTVEVQAINYTGTVFRSVPLRISTPAASGAAPLSAKNSALAVQRAAFATLQPAVRTLTTAASLPPPLPSQWLDVWVSKKSGPSWIKTSDGILDEVMELDDPGRNSVISITGVTLTYTYTVLGTSVSSPFALHWELDTTAFFGTSSFTDISDPDGNYDGPVGLNEQPVLYFVHVETNYTGHAEFELAPGYDYGVYSMTNGNDANDPSKWEREGSPTQIAGTTRGRIEMSDLQPPSKKWYRLVKYGRDDSFVTPYTSANPIQAIFGNSYTVVETISGEGPNGASATVDSAFAAILARLEALMGRSLTLEEKQHLRLYGCVGIARIAMARAKIAFPNSTQMPQSPYPERAPEADLWPIKAYAHHIDAITAGCPVGMREVLYAVEGSWRGVAPVPNANGEVPVDSIDPNNYIVRMPSPNQNLWFNVTHGLHPTKGNPTIPQTGFITAGPPPDDQFPVRAMIFVRVCVPE